MLSKKNFHEKEKLGELIESFGCEFRPSTMIFARLNADTIPCDYRLPIHKLIPDEIADECVKNASNATNATNAKNTILRKATRENMRKKTQSIRALISILRRLNTKLKKDIMIRSL